jgi:hypothetical protein
VTILSRTITDLESAYRAASIGTRISAFFGAPLILRLQTRSADAVLRVFRHPSLKHDNFSVEYFNVPQGCVRQNATRHTMLFFP